MSEEIAKNGFMYSINENEKTASIEFIMPINDAIIIPRSIYHNSKEYTIISILENAFYSQRIKSIQFAPDSKIRTIEKDALSNTQIEQISIPASLVELKEGWFGFSDKLTKIQIDPNNPIYTCYEDKLILEKSRGQESYNTLVFAVRNIVEAKIPKSIKVIGPYSFQACDQLQQIEFPPDSELQIVDKYAFAHSSIQNISIPSHVTKLCEGSFYNCKNLQQITFPSNSELQTIEKEAFCSSSIEEISFPASLVELKRGWCSFADNLKKIEIDPRNPIFTIYEDKYVLQKSNEEQKNFDILVFAVRKITEAKIPKMIKVIGPYAFQNCKELQQVEFYPDSELQIIGEKAFSLTSIKNISIPPSVTKICKEAFSSCNKLEQIEIPTNSELRTIEENAFGSISFENIWFPQSLIELDKSWCYSSHKLRKIEIDPRNPLYSSYNGKFILGKSNKGQKDFDVLLFAIDDYEIKVPKFIKEIGPQAFKSCSRVQNIVFPPDSELQIIGKEAFSNLNFINISIPKHVTQICEGAFESCYDLKRVYFPPDSELQIIGTKAFSNTNISSISIPSHVTKICEYAFESCFQLERVDIPQDSQIQEINEKAFSYSMITCISIPLRIIQNCDLVMSECTFLKLIEITDDSEIKSFDRSLLSKISDSSPYDFVMFPV